MRKILIPLATLALALVAGARAAHAGGNKGSFGVGYEQMLSGPGGVSVNYDGGQFHAGGFVGFANNDFALGGDDSDVDFGVRFYWHAHSTAMADFGVGGGFGFLLENRPDPMNDLSELYFDLGGQIRYFPGVANVALSATFGLAIGVNDADGVALGGAPEAAFGVHYYFF
jgi:hypothetical protein